MATIKNLPPEQQRQWRANCAKGGRSGKHEDKVRAGKLGFQARLKKLKEKAAQQAAQQTA